MSTRTLKELRSNLEGRIHIYLKDTKTAMQFMIDAENEGYRLGKKKPTECDTDDIIALGENQLSYVTFCGRVCFQCNGGSNSEGEYHRIDYDKYKNGDADFYFQTEE